MGRHKHSSHDTVDQVKVSKAAREKINIIHKGKNIKMTRDTEATSFKELKEKKKNCQLNILYSTKTSFNNKGKRGIFFQTCKI